MTRTLVTGATGFIGRHLVPQLLDAGQEVIACGTEPAEQLAFPWLKRVQYVSCDINEPRDDWFERLHRPTRLVHLAWPGLPNYRELFHIEKNLPAAYAFIKSFVQDGVSDITVTGTCFEYGKQEGELSEDSPALPVTAYAMAKDALRRFLEVLRSHCPFSLKWVRLFYLYGEGQAAGSILAQLRSAIQKRESEFRMSGGEQLRDYLPVEIVAQYLSRIATAPNFSGIVNCCSGAPISIRRLVEQHVRAANSDIRLHLGYYPYSDYQPMAFWGSVKRLHSLFPPPENPT
ncbi:MAG TPA: NAD-dependent epimerase/dehydratase family protein [Candidatus Ozemobacteraceae bacterium]|nr:NAD-dependent epimerase/dehydratase family protein [Candidatus Ozemobacteraceae bacterium]